MAGSLVILIGSVVELAAQDEVEATAIRFFNALGRLRWQPLAQELHPEALAEFEVVSDDLVQSLRGDSVLIQLYGSSRAEYRAWTASQKFVRSMEGLVQYARGLMESQVTTAVRILGAVPEGDSVRHVVYREVTNHMGTVLDGVLVLTLAEHGGRWLVRHNAELEVLKTALRGIPIGRGMSGSEGFSTPFERGGAGVASASKKVLLSTPISSIVMAPPGSARPRSAVIPRRAGPVSGSGQSSKETERS